MFWMLLSMKKYLNQSIISNDIGILSQLQMSEQVQKSRFLLRLILYMGLLNSDTNTFNCD